MLEAQKLFEEPERLANRLRVLLKEIERLRADLLPGGIDYTQDRVQGGATGNRNDVLLDRIAELEAEVEQLQARRDWLRFIRLPVLISRVTVPMAQDVLRDYYLADETMAQVCETLHISNVTGYRYRRIGLEEVERMIAEK